MAEEVNIMPHRFFRGKDVHENFSLTVSGGATPNDLSDEMVVKGAQEVSVNAENGNSTDLDVFIYVNYRDGGAYTTTPYASMNLGASEVDQVPIMPGIYGIKIKIVNNDAVNASAVTTGFAAAWR